MLARHDEPLLASEVQQRLLRFFPDDRVATVTEIRSALETRRGPDGNRHSSRTGHAESVLIPRPREGRSPAETAPTARIFTIFEGTSEIQRMLIGRTVTGLDVR
jgi:alkylation response protein AidB-like acyl-CoA dehydrogenase